MLFSASAEQALIRFSALDLTSWLPASFELRVRAHVDFDDQPALWLRFAPDGAGLAGEQVAVLLDPLSDRLLGLTRLHRGMVQADLPTREQAATVATAFLEQVAPELVDDRTVLWIERHDETVVYEGAEHLVAGMKVKMRRPSDGLYFWVIVAGDGQVITFERDIYWIEMPGKRRTQKWLHDQWLQETARLSQDPKRQVLQLADETAVRSVVLDYFLGTWLGDGALCERAFHPEAFVSGYLGDAPREESAPAFITRVLAQPPLRDQGDAYQKTLTHLQIDGPLAWVTAEVRVLSFLFRDYLTLHRIEGCWVIRHKSYRTL